MSLLSRMGNYYVSEMHLYVVLVDNRKRLEEDLKIEEEERIKKDMEIKKNFQKMIDYYDKLHEICISKKNLVEKILKNVDLEMRMICVVLNNQLFNKLNI